MTRPPPSAKVPLWLRVLFPFLRGLESNGLYIRYSSQGFGKRFRRFPRWPKEFAFKWPDLGTRFGALPIIAPAIGAIPAVTLFQLSNLLIFFGIFDPWSPANQNRLWVMALIGCVMAFLQAHNGLAFWLVIERIVGGDSSRRLHAYVRNASRDGWGGDLVLAPLDPVAHDRALIGALMQQEARVVRLFLFLGIACGIPFAWMIGGAMRRGDPAFPTDFELAASLMGTVTLTALAAEALGLGAMLLASEWRSAAALGPAWMKPGWRATLRRAAWVLPRLWLTHLPGLLADAMFIGEGFDEWEKEMIEANVHHVIPHALLYSAVVIIFAVPAFFLMAWIARRELKRSLGAVSLAFAETVRDG